MKGALFAAAMVVLLVGAILVAEHMDRRKDKRCKRILKNGVRVKGRVAQLRRQGILDARNGYQWSLIVEFEYRGKKYSIDVKCVRKPVYSAGDPITVHVDTDDPWKSVVQI